ncbi:hypothetical protein QVD17_21346 [Tagetes erecta]|uniref:Gnk2-homologous domain-containing protein n=1 Tax=Tagetes erecta TaxID=13708 RepID=A0AAD8NTG7_TARER|nr:hypothetical protein QVD17_21346 [Tagetes erecta]
MKSIMNYLEAVAILMVMMYVAIAEAEAGGRQEEEIKPNQYMCRGGDIKSVKIRDSALNQLMESFKKSSKFNGFYHTQAAAGNKSEEVVSAHFLCPPNIHLDYCTCCVKNTITILRKKCTKHNEGVAWDSYPYIDCMVRYTTGRKILSVLDDWAWHRIPDVNYVKTLNLQKTLDSMTGKLTEKAAGGDGVKKFAGDKVNYDGNEHVLYVSAQCTPDISKQDCIKCLTKATVEMRNCCSSKPLFGGSVLSTNCCLRYWHIDLFNPPAVEIDKDLCG